MVRWVIRLAGLAWLAIGLATVSCRADQPLTGAETDYDALLAMIGPARVVMLGEATHGSREFYSERVRITRRLIDEQGFDAVVLEAPWEPVRRLDAYIRGEGRDRDAAEALAGFVRFPDWPSRNSEVRDFAESLRAVNRIRAGQSAPVRLYGMDLYSVPESADAVVRHAARRSVAAAAVAHQRYRCFDDYRAEPMFYGRETVAGRALSCAAGAAAQLAEMDSAAADEDDFAAWQSARVVSSGEGYYRALYRGESVGSWNLRERHMADTIVQLLERLGPRSRIVVWAHNLHQGDARATDQARGGELSLGQLMRERYGDGAVLVGFSTYRGQVRAAPGGARRTASGACGRRCAEAGMSCCIGVCRAAGRRPCCWCFAAIRRWPRSSPCGGRSAQSASSTCRMPSGATITSMLFCPRSSTP